jgi:Cu2+-exporting ATPase
VAVLTCPLCDGPVDRPVPDGPRTFCCHGCRDLWHLLGEERVAEVKSRPGVVWDAVRSAVTADSPDAADTASPAGRVRALTLHVDGMWCASCSILVESVLTRRPGVLRARVDFATATARVGVDDDTLGVEDLARAVAAIGYGASANPPGAEEEAAADRDLLRRFALASVLAMFVMMFSVPVWSGYLPLLLPWQRDLLGAGLGSAAGAVVFWAGWPFLQGAWAAVRSGVPTMDLLVALGALSAYGYSVAALMAGGRYLYFDTASMLVAFLLLGRAMEAGTLHRAAAAVRMLATLLPAQAVVVRDGGEVALDPSHLVAGDRVVVRPGSRLPADGEVEAGEAEVDESFLTGEPLPARRRPGEGVYAGSLVVDGHLVVRVRRPPGESVLAQTARYVQAAQGGGGRLRRAADRVLRLFVPLVLAVAVASFALDRLVGHAPLAAAMLHAVAVLVVACPCALSVATPLAVLAGADRLSRLGVLLRDDAALERAARVDDVVWDKTGTLTTGVLALTGAAGDDRALALAAAVEEGSAHPVARALREEARARGLAVPAPEGAVHRSGLGVSGRVEGMAVRVAALDRAEVPREVADAAALGTDGAVLVGVWLDDRPAAVYALADRVRPEAAAAVARLAAGGRRVWLVTGDGEGPARAVAEAVGIAPERVRWRHGPQEKAELVSGLRREGRRVAFVGDGVNDAPALAAADLGLAMGSGTDIAAEAGHLVLAGGRLDAVPEVLSISREVAQTIRRNLAWASLYNAAAIPAAAFGLASPTLAAAAMVASSAFVLGNSLRILGLSPWRYARGALAVASWLGLLVAAARLGL